MPNKSGTAVLKDWTKKQVSEANIQMAQPLMNNQAPLRDVPKAKADLAFNALPIQNPVKEIWQAKAKAEMPAVPGQMGESRRPNIRRRR